MLEDLTLYSTDVLVEQPWVLGVALFNDGRAPVRPADFDGPVVFDFALEDERGFLQVTMVSELGAFHDFAETADGRSILSIEPILLNPGDRVEFVTLSDGQPRLQGVRGRVAGIGELKEARRGDDPDDRLSRLQTRNMALTIVALIAGAVFAALTVADVIASLGK